MDLLLLCFVSPMRCPMVSGIVDAMPFRLEAWWPRIDETGFVCWLVGWLGAVVTCSDDREIEGDRTPYKHASISRGYGGGVGWDEGRRMGVT